MSNITMLRCSRSNKYKMLPLPAVSAEPETTMTLLTLMMSATCGGNNYVAVAASSAALCFQACVLTMCLFCKRDAKHRPVPRVKVKEKVEAHGTRGPDQTCKHFVWISGGCSMCVCL